MPQPPAPAVAVAQLDLAAGGGERAAGEVAGVDEVGQRPPGGVGADALAEHGVRALDDAVEAGERHADRRVVEGVAEALAAVRASARASSFRRQCTTLTIPSAPMKSAWTAAQRHGCATASGWL